MRNGLRLGDRVAYTAAFLRETGLMNSHEGQMRGEVLGFEPISERFTFAVLKLDSGDTRLVNTQNLVKVGVAEWVRA